MRRSFPPMALACLLCAAGAAQETSPSPTEIAARQENASNAAFRYRAAIAGLLPLKPGVVAAEMLQSIAAALKPGGALLIVDIPREGVGSAQVGIDADDVVAMAIAAGFKREAESAVVPGQYAIRFRRP